MTARMRHLLLVLCTLGAAQATPAPWRVELPAPARDIAVVGDGLHAALDDGTVVVVAESGARPVTGVHGARRLSAESLPMWVARDADVTRGWIRVALPGVRDLAAGYGDTAFAVAERLYVVADERARVLTAKLEAPTAVEVVGGRLLVGTHKGLEWVSLSTGALSPMAAVGPVRGIATDHVGHFVVTTAGGVLRVTSEGKATPLEITADGPVAVHARRLYTLSADRRAVVAHDYLALVGEDAAPWAARDARPMRPFTHAGLTLTGAEYWPNRGTTKTRYPEDVLWGFYPEKGVVFEGEAAPASARPAAVACAEASFHALRTFMDTRPEKLHQLAKRPSVSSRFYLWVNDYSEASADFPHPVRPGRLWYWQREPAVVGRVPGYWKWETTLTRSGVCQIPSEPQIDAYLTERVEAAADATPRDD